MLPLLLLAGATLAGREAYAGNIRQDFANQVREGIGERPQLVGPGRGESGEELAGPPQQQGGRGLLGSVSDPVQAAYLEMLGKVAGVRHAPMDAILRGVGQVASESGLARRQEAGFQHDIGQQGRSQDFAGAQQQRAQEWQGIMQMNSQDFQAWQNDLGRQQADAQQRRQFGQAWALENFRQAAENARAAQRTPSGMTYYAGAPAGPGGQPQPILGPQSGTEQYVKGVESVRSARNAVKNADDLLESYHKGGQGPEFTGPEAGRQAAMYQQLITDTARAADLGTIQKGDLEFIQSFQRNPGDFWSKVYAKDPTTIAVLERTREGFARNFSMRREANPWTVGLQGDLGTELGATPTAESVAKKFSGRADADTRARLQRVGHGGPRGDATLGGN